MLRHLSSSDKPKVAGSRVGCVDVTGRKASLEVIGVQRLVTVYRVVTACVVRAVHPDLRKKIHS